MEVQSNVTERRSDANIRSYSLPVIQQQRSSSNARRSMQSQNPGWHHLAGLAATWLFFEKWRTSVFLSFHSKPETAFPFLSLGKLKPLDLAAPKTLGLALQKHGPSLQSWLTMSVRCKAEQNSTVNLCFSKACPWYFQPVQLFTGLIAQTDYPGSRLFRPTPWCSHLSEPYKRVCATACDSKIAKSFSNPEGIVGNPCKKRVSEHFWHAVLCDPSDTYLITSPCWICLSCHTGREADGVLLLFLFLSYLFFNLEFCKH